MQALLGRVRAAVTPEPSSSRSPAPPLLPTATQRRPSGNAPPMLERLRAAITPTHFGQDGARPPPPSARPAATAPSGPGWMERMRGAMAAIPAAQLSGPRPSQRTEPSRVPSRPSRPSAPAQSGPGWLDRVKAVVPARSGPVARSGPPAPRPSRPRPDPSAIDEKSRASGSQASASLANAKTAAVGFWQRALGSGKTSGAPAKTGVSGRRSAEKAALPQRDSAAKASSSGGSGIKKRDPPKRVTPPPPYVSGPGPPRLPPGPFASAPPRFQSSGPTKPLPFRSVAPMPRRPLKERIGPPRLLIPLPRPGAVKRPPRAQILATLTALTFPPRWDVLKSVARCSSQADLAATSSASLSTRSTTWTPSFAPTCRSSTTRAATSSS